VPEYTPFFKIIMSPDVAVVFAFFIVFQGPLAEPLAESLPEGER
jgi:hypothetical protein